MKYISGICLLLSSFVDSRIEVPLFGPNVPNSVDMNTQIAFFANQDPLEVALEFAKSQYPTENGLGIVVKNNYQSFNGVQNIYLRQTFNNVEISNADMNIHIKDNQIFSYASSFFTGPLPTSSHGLFSGQLVLDNKKEITASEAVIYLSKYIKQSLDKDNLLENVETSLNGQTSVVINNIPFAEDNKAELTRKYIIVTKPYYALVPVWDISLHTKDGDNAFHAQLDVSDGNILEIVDWVKEAHYNIYPIGVNDPHDGDRAILVNPEDKNASPLGWHDQGSSGKEFSSTVGNNVWAQANWPGSSSYETKYRPDGVKARDGSLIFDFPIDFSKDPKQYVDASVTNLFYWNNVMHDVFWQFGFDEPSGNFQEDNVSRGGRGNDAVIAFAQDGTGYNNANMMTPPDGQKPRMRMYIWSESKPMRDGDLEAGIIIHEYAHGISIRLTGGPSNVNCLSYGESGGMGEGWGDFFSLVLRMRENYTRDKNFEMGKYSATYGIRPYPYSTSLKTNPQTYSTIYSSGYSGVHAKGSVWSEILYEVYWEVVEKFGFSPKFTGIRREVESGKVAGNIALLYIVVDAMKLQPCRPTFIDARNAILKSDEINFNGKYKCSLWKGFAKRGLGVNAVNPKNGFEIPTECK
jgi:extracellular elastinolytic metalloproteinase